MSQYQKILLIADPSMHRTPAFERAAWLARSTGAALHIVLFDRSSSIAAWALLDARGAEQARTAWLQARRNWLGSEVQVLRGHGIKASVEAAWTHPVYEEILAHINEYHPDLVIKDIKHEPMLKRVLLKPLDWHLLRECPTPVLLVNSQARTAPHRVIAAIDGHQATAEAEDFNNAIIKSALSLALQCNLELDLVSSFDGLMSGGDGFGGVSVITPDLYEALCKLHATSFAAIAKAHGVPPERAHSLTGPPSMVLSDLANNPATDVLVVGTHRRHGIDRLLMGSIAEAIVDNAGCDVLVVKP